MKRDKWEENQHKKNFESFRELAIRISRGLLKIMSITIDEPEFGHIRITMFVQEEKNGR